VTLSQYKLLQGQALLLLLFIFLVLVETTLFKNAYNRGYKRTATIAATIAPWCTPPIRIRRFNFKTDWDGIKLGKIFLHVFTARCNVVHSAVLRSHVVRLSLRPSVRLSVRPSVRPSDVCDVGGVWKSWKLSTRTLSPTAMLFVTERPSTYSQGNMGKFWGD